MEIKVYPFILKCVSTGGQKRTNEKFHLKIQSSNVLFFWIFTQLGQDLTVKIVCRIFLPSLRSITRKRLTEPGLNPLSEGITGVDGPTEDKRHTEDHEPSKRPQLRPIEIFWKNFKRMIY